MSDLASALEEARGARQDAVQRLAHLDGDALTAAAPWRGAPADVRFLLLRLADDDLMRVLQLRDALARAGHRPTEAQRILEAVRAGRGRLRGSLIGLSAEQFEQGWGDDEWSVRRVLGHIIATDRRYAIQTLHAVQRARAGGVGPLRPPDSALPDRAGLAESAGSITDLLARLDATHDACIADLAGLPDVDLDAVTNWVGRNLDVRFRLFRFAEHDREHFVQLRKAYVAVGFVPTEAQRILEEAAAIRGALEGLLVGLAAEGPASTAVAAVLTEAAVTERSAVAAIVEAVSARS